MTLPREIARNPKKGEKIAFFCNLSQNQVPYFFRNIAFLQFFLSNFISSCQWLSRTQNCVFKKLFVRKNWHLLKILQKWELWTFYPKKYQKYVKNSQKEGKNALKQLPIYLNFQLVSKKMIQRQKKNYEIVLLPMHGVWEERAW